MTDFAEIKIRVNHNALSVISNNLLTSGTINAIKVKYFFKSNEWDNLTKSAVFTKGDETYTVDITDTGECLFPHEVLETEGNVYFGVCGTSENTRLPSQRLNLEVVTGCYSDSPEISADPTPQLKAILHDIDSGKFGEATETGDEDFPTAIIRVTHNKLSMVREAIPVSGSINSIKIKLLFKTSEWDSLRKVAVFVLDDTNYVVIPDDNDCCFIPWEVLDNTVSFKFGVFGTNDTAKLPTEMIIFDVVDGCPCSGETPGAPSPSEVEQLWEAINTKQDILIAGQNIEIKDNVISSTGADKTYTHVQSSASSEWTVEHNLNKTPSITVVDSADNVVAGDAQYVNQNLVKIKFIGAFSGKAFLN